MKFKISSFKEPKHSQTVVSVCWNNTEDVFSCGDDHRLLKWNIINGDCIEVAQFYEDFCPTFMNLFPRVSIGTNKQQHDVILIACTDGKFHIISQNGRTEKSVVAHEGACISAQWSPDGAGLFTAGEDGALKIWSRNGLLRSVLLQSDTPCYSATWSPDSSAILLSKGGLLVIKNLSSNSKVTKWKAHEGIIVSLAWNANNNLILSGGEDGYFKIWDMFGQLVSSSVKHEQPITSVSWASAGDLFAVGSFNLLRLCNSSGWSHCLTRPNTGSILCLSWSSDGTQLAAACSNGHVIFAHIVDRNYSWKTYTCNQTGRTSISINNLVSEHSDQLDYPDRVIQIALGFNHLVVSTTKQCFIHPLNSWNTPVTFDLKEGTINMILLAERCFCIIERISICIYGYMGRLLASPRWTSMRSETLGKSSISLSSDMLAVIDQIDRKVILMFDLPTGLLVRASADTTTNKIAHTMTVSAVALSQTGPLNERQLAFLDYNRDLYVTTAKDMKNKIYKLSTQVLDICWSPETEILAGLRANSVVAWCCPKAAPQPDWLPLTTVSKEISDLGRNPSIISIEDGVVNICKGNGVLMPVSLVPFPEKLLKHIAANMWHLALQLCRSVEDETLWACLAVLAMQNHQLVIAEEAFSLIRAYHQVYFIQHLRGNEPEKVLP